MINCIAIDDEPQALEVIKIHSSKIPELNLSACFTNPMEGLEYLKDNYTDLIFLDINMPELSGLDFLKKLHLRPYIIFTTAYSEFALESYDFEAIDYLLKPIVFDRFNMAVVKVKKQMQLNTIKTADNQLSFIFIKDGYKQVRININEILYIQSDGNYLNIITIKDKVMARMTFQQLFEKTGRRNFQRVHNSYAVALNHIEKIEDNHIYIHEHKIPVGVSYRDKLTNLIDPIS